MASTMNTAPTTRPMGFSGVTSPYPTVVTVCNAHHSPVPKSGNSSRSSTVINAPPTITLTTVAETITAIALRTDSGVLMNASNRRSTRPLRAMPFRSLLDAG